MKKLLKLVTFGSLQEFQKFKKPSEILGDTVADTFAKGGPVLGRTALSNAWKELSGVVTGPTDKAVGLLNLFIGDVIPALTNMNAVEKREAFSKTYDSYKSNKAIFDGLLMVDGITAEDIRGELYELYRGTYFNSHGYIFLCKNPEFHPTATQDFILAVHDGRYCQL